MHNLELVKNHALIAQNHLLQQYKEQPRLNSLVLALTQGLQETENKLYEIYRNYSIVEAQGGYLDRIGAIACEARNYRQDDEYRLAILARIMINNGGGTPEDIISALRFTFNPKRLRFKELYPACFSVFMQASNINASCKGLINSIKPIGITDFVIVFINEDNPFIFAECSSENVAFKTKATTDDESDAKVMTEIDVQSFDVEIDSLLFPEGYIGFAEIIVTKTNLNLGGDDIYLVEEDDPLEMLLTYEDFKITGSSKLAEVIENG